MAITVLYSKDLIKHLTTGETPVPAGVAEDNAKQQARADKENGKTNGKAADSAGDKGSAEATGKATEGAPAEEEEVEGEDGLTPSERRDYTSRMLKTVGRKTRQVKEAEEFAAEQYNQRVLADKRAEKAEQERENFKAELAKLQPAKVETSTEPQREKFATDKEYQDAMIDWRVDQKLKAKETEIAEQRRLSVQQNVKASLDRALELIPDFEEVTSAAELNVPGHIVHLMQESGLFAEFGYHFAKNPDELAKLAIATPNKLKLEFQKIESKLTPFASRTAAGADGKPNGQKPSASETESAKPTAAASANGVDPSTKPRVSAPIITPLSAGSDSQVERPARERTYAEEREAWQKKNQRNLNLRKRH